MGSGLTSLYTLSCKPRSQGLVRMTHDPHLPFSLALEFCAANWALSSIAAERPAAFVVSWTMWAIFDQQRSSA